MITLITTRMTTSMMYAIARFGTSAYTSPAVPATGVGAGPDGAAQPDWGGGVDGSVGWGCCGGGCCSVIPHLLIARGWGAVNRLDDGRHASAGRPRCHPWKVECRPAVA